MVDRWTIIERLLTGPKMTRMEWMMHTYRKATDWCKEGGIKFDPKATAEDYKEMADRLWSTTLKYSADTGIWDIESGRVVEFTEDELERYIRSMSNEMVLGEGKDRRVLKRRSVEGTGPFLVSAGHAPVSSDMLGPLYRSMMSLPCIDWVEGSNLPYLGKWGDESKRVTGPHEEILASYVQARTVRQSMRDVGKPGMAWMYYTQGKSIATQISVFDREWGMRPCDLYRVVAGYGQIIEGCWLGVAFAAQNHGCNIQLNAGYTPVEFAGGLENSLIMSLAGNIMQHVCYGAHVGGFGGGGGGGAAYGAYIRTRLKPVELRWISMVSTYCRDKYYQGPHFTMIGGSPYEPNLLKRFGWIAMGALSGITRGVSGLLLSRTSITRKPNLITPLEAQFMYEVGNTALKERLTMEDAREIMERFPQEMRANAGPEWEVPAHKLKGYDAPYIRGKRFDELYDITKFIPTPLQEHIDMYEKARKTMADIGLPLI